MQTNWNQLKENREIAFLRGDLVTSSSQSYTLEEMKAISDEMAASTAEVEAALRADFQAMPAFAQPRRLPVLLAQSRDRS